MPDWQDPRTHRLAPAAAFAQQFGRLRQDLNRQVFGHPHRWLTIWFNPLTWVLIQHRFERSMFLILGNRWGAVRIPLMPLFFALHPWLGWADISYQADIGGGLVVLHPGLGVVIAQGVQAGDRLQLTGGNTIGWQHGGSKGRAGEFVLGNDINIGANATVLGPVVLGDNTAVGANAVVIRSFAGPGVLAGVPAKPLGDATESATVSPAVSGDPD